MKNIIAMLIVFISAEAFSQVTPRLFIEPAPIFDILCQTKTDYKIDTKLQNEVQTEIYEKIGNFQSEWDNAAASLIPESENAAGRNLVVGNIQWHYRHVDGFQWEIQSF